MKLSLKFTNYRGIFHQNRNMVSKEKSPTSEFTNFGSHQLRGMTVRIQIILKTILAAFIQKIAKN